MVERLRSLSVEPPKGTESLTIHMVRVLSLWSSASGPLPLLSLMVEQRLRSSPYGRACLRILNSRACLRILNSRACLRILISRVC
jgi:hypothetical protein